eukprot:CAMPEP_0114528174 /NCGR_PEP_ID=MMETSP0109-20121206/24052_1 /TAXON_ID=29199 /ORGANISM="Chlorarachnion reptans, Strain CCCM449" /LENGTH=35 /DNA_ID= /DNA_START= /DNA_END= /DNA_ORIENTATION=
MVGPQQLATRASIVEHPQVAAAEPWVLRMAFAQGP